jgi:hypothetical protein
VITVTGESVWPRGSEHGDQGAPSLRAIGVGLARTVRFAGQTSRFYTVLAHTFTVAELLPEELHAYALLHDAPEAIVGDVSATWKTDDHRAAEDDLLERISRSVGLPWPWAHDVWAAVKVADETALAAEAHVLGHVEAEKWWPRQQWLDGDEGFPMAEENTRRRSLQCVGLVRSPWAAAGQYATWVDVALPKAVR